MKIFAVLVTRRPRKCFDCPIRPTCVFEKIDIAPKHNPKCLLRLRKKWKLVRHSQLPPGYVAISKEELQELRRVEMMWSHLHLIGNNERS